MNLLIRFAIFAGFLFNVAPGAVQAFDFTEADQMFAQRGESSALLERARTKYLSLLTQLSGDERAYAIEQVARLDALAGLKFMDSNPAERSRLFDRCLTDLDQFNPQTQGAKPFYYYWKSVCLAQWARANGILESLFRVDELLQYLDSGEAIDKTYEGGGFARIRGATYAKLPPINPFGPRQDLNRSRLLLESSAASPAYTQSHTPEWDTGDFYYSTYFYLAETLVAMGLQNEALNVINDATGRIDAGEVPPMREPEERLSYQYMIALKATILHQ